MRICEQVFEDKRVDVFFFGPHNRMASQQLGLKAILVNEVTCDIRFEKIKTC